MQQSLLYFIVSLEEASCLRHIHEGDYYQAGLPVSIMLSMSLNAFSKASV